MNKVIWMCESCSTENLSVRSETTMPMCGGCEKHFDWNDIVHVSDDQDAYLNLIDEISLDLYNKPACDLLEEPDAAVHLLQDAYNSNIKPNMALKNIRIKQAKELWGKFGDIPVNEDDKLEEPFLIFDAGEDRFNVWSWFESEFECSVAKDLMAI